MYICIYICEVFFGMPFCIQALLYNGFPVLE